MSVILLLFVFLVSWNNVLPLLNPFSGSPPKFQGFQLSPCFLLLYACFELLSYTHFGPDSITHHLLVVTTDINHNTNHFGTKIFIRFVNWGMSRLGAFHHNGRNLVILLLSEGCNDINSLSWLERDEVLLNDFLHCAGEQFRRNNRYESLLSKSSLSEKRLAFRDTRSGFLRPFSPSLPIFAVFRPLRCWNPLHWLAWPHR